MIQSSKRTKLQIKNKADTKRYLVDQAIVAAVAVSPATILTRNFGLLFFGLGLVFFSVVPFDSAGYTNIALPGDLDFFWNIFHNVDETRGDVSRNLIALQEMFSRDLAQMTNRHDVFATAYPALIGDYEAIMRLLASVLEQIQLHANTGPMDIRLDQMVAWETVATYLDDASDILGRLIDSI